MTRTARSRKHRSFDLEARLEPVSAWVIRQPQDLRGRWASWGPRVPDAQALTEAPPNLSRDAPAAAGGIVPAASTAGEPTSAAPAAGRPVPRREPEAALAGGPRRIAETGSPKRPVYVDLGCGKGSFLAAMAQRADDALWLGIDAEPVCCMHAAENLARISAPNAGALLDADPDLSQLFSPHEVSGLYLNFPTPFPQRKKAPLRTVHYDRLRAYRTALKETGTLHLRTDSPFLFRYATDQLLMAGFDLLWSREGDEPREELPRELSPLLHHHLPETEYERKLRQRGARVLELVARPSAADPEPPSRADVEKRANISLLDLLPDDLDQLDYVPLGMEGAVENLRNRRLRALRAGRGVANV
ncbi:hypothetical protein HLV37_04720 [Eggerthellaceae bacterium zg-1084]|uniref:tRNA (guanine(46)-N(7))-methyltransferase TrmB n=1 Tax=Berryella wangjianweii TaxID=2734634 RepID=UPI0015532701|nr:hypothetical protein [Berryella wangjianweii]NPD31165.1 hypothetical protein [Berryella wangjianweii]